MDKEKILLIGGIGFIGSNVCRKLVELGHKVTILDSFINYTSPFESEIDYGQIIRDRFEGIADKIQLVRGDAKYISILRSVIEETQAKRIVHFGSMPISKLSNILIGEAIDSTIISTSNLLEIQHGLWRLFGSPREGGTPQGAEGNLWRGQALRGDPDQSLQQEVWN
jgi:UDP-glucose 4-epimerase